MAELRSLLSARETQDLPETVEGLRSAAARDGLAFRNAGSVLLIECRDAELVERIAADSETRDLCQRAGPKPLVVRVDAEDRFRKAVHGLGYGMPRQ